MARGGGGAARAPNDPYVQDAPLAWPWVLGFAVAAVVSTLVVVGVSASFARGGGLKAAIVLVIGIGAIAYIVLLGNAGRGIDSAHRYVWQLASGGLGIGLGALFWLSFTLQLDDERGRSSAFATALLLLSILCLLVGWRLLAGRVRT